MLSYSYRETGFLKAFASAIILALLLLFSPEYGIAAETNVDITIDMDSAKKVNPDLFGFQMAEFRNCDISDTAFRQYVTTLKPKVLRFPFGSWANFYHPDGMGYGFRDEELKRIEGTGTYATLERFNKFYKEKPADRNYINQFIELSKLTDSKVLVIANIATGTEEELLSMIRQMKQSGVNVVGVELGNELYLDSYANLVRNVDDYISKAERFASAVRKSYPDLKIAVTAAPARFDRKIGFLRASSYDNWNNSLAKKKFYDAYVVHSYKSVSNCEKESTLEGTFSCASGELMNYSNKDLQKVIDYYYCIFGKEKSVWLTEWNIELPIKFGNTDLQALYSADFLLSQTRIDATSMGNIEYSLFHDLCDKWYAFSVVNTKFSGEEAIDPGSNYIRRCSYFPFQFMKDAFADNVVRLTTSKSGIPDDNTFSSHAFLNQSKSELYIYFLNWSGNTYIAKNSFKNNNYRLPKEADFDYFSGNSLFASRGVTGFKKELGDLHAFKTSSGVMSLQSVKISPYSFGVLKIKLQ
ncbi:MAG: hypothetical protein HYS21_05945 [Deltaproteobacteria bacterium]|nr:hypothetical protein [Deltaproteobacteria bacterium]